MGIKGLTKFLQDAAPKACKELKGPEAYTGRIIAIDASMCLYQFLIMIRDNAPGAYSNLMNEEGRVTSHIVGFLSRTIRLMEAGIKPVYIFDGKPPEIKLGELEVRRNRRDKAEAALAEAKEAGDDDQILKSTKMTVKVTPEHNEQTKRLLRLMGVPVVEAPSEAEATCARLCRAGKVHAAATEDADCLTFGTRLLVRNLLAAEALKKQLIEINLDVALEQLGISMDQFIDFCILCGCDYCDALKGIGPNTAIKLVMQHGSLEKIVESLDKEKTPIPSGFRFQAARDFFKECETVDPNSVDLVWKDPDFEALKKFLVEENTFAEDRVLRFFDRMRAAKSKTKQQPLDRFFGVAKPVVRECDKYDPNKKKASSKAKAKAKAKGAAAKSEIVLPPEPEAEPHTEPQPAAKGKAKAKAKGKAAGGEPPAKRARR